jgi:endonuclease/exonuclease/phosphatase family metal-dependent hydrolase
LRLVTWNCHDFFDTIKGNCGDWCPGELVLTAAQYDTKKRKIAQVLRELDGDVVVLQEIENIGVLNDLANHELFRGRPYYQYRELVSGNDPRGINIGVMSRLPLDRFVSHKEKEYSCPNDPSVVKRFARDGVEIHLTRNGLQFAIVGMHLLSQKDGESGERRRAEACHVRRIADNIKSSDPSKYVFIMGDMNDEPNSQVYTAISTRSDPEALVYRPVTDVYFPVEDRYTYVFRGSTMLLDYIYADPDAWNHLDASSVTIKHDLMPETSDHDPVAATFVFP